MFKAAFHHCCTSVLQLRANNNEIRITANVCIHSGAHSGHRFKAVWLLLFVAAGYLIDLMLIKAYR